MADQPTGIPVADIIADALDNIQNVLVGTPGPDTITDTVTPRNDLMIGLGGDDTLSASTGRDVLIGSEGSDHLSGGAVSFGGPGNDTISAASGNFVSFGGAGDDVLTGGTTPFSGPGALFGGAGNDTLHGGFHTEMHGGAGDDLMTLVRADSQQPVGDFVIDGGAGFDTLDISQAGDVGPVSSPPNVPGLPFLSYDFRGPSSGGVQGIEHITMQGTRANTIAIDLEGARDLSDQTDTVRIDGDADDRLIVQGGWDQAGTQTIGGAAYQVLTHQDVTLLVASSVAVESSDGPLFPSGPIIGTEADERLFGTPGDDVIEGREGGDDLFGLGGNDVLHGGNSGDFLSGDGSDMLDGGPGDDLLNGGVGADIFVFRPDYGHDQVYWFEDGFDRLNLGGFDSAAILQALDQESSVTLPSGAPMVTLDFGHDDVLTVVGTNRIDIDDVIFNPMVERTGTAGDDTILGTDAAEILVGREGNDTLIGGNNADALFGGNRADFLAGDGNDILDGGLFNDLLDGGAGADTYVFSPGYEKDLVYWFEDGSDRLDLRKFGVSTAADLAGKATITVSTEPSGASAVTLDFNHHDILTVVGVDHIDDTDLV